MSYTYIQILYCTFLFILTIVVGGLYYMKMKTEGFESRENRYIFYHIYCNKETAPIVKDQIAKIVFSELYKTVTSVYCFLVGEESVIKEIKTILNNYGSKFKIAAEGPGDKTYERFTLLKIRDYIKSDDKFLYIHTKGVSKNSSDSIYYWRTYMEYNLFTNASNCIELLNTYDIVGVAHSTFSIGPHFSGNFWWSTGKYYLSLAPTIGSDYFAPEAYIFTGNPKYKDIDDGRFSNILKGNDLNLYKNIIYPNIYLR